MANYILSIFLLAIIATSAAQAAEAVGSREIDLPDAAGDRTRHVSMWYPTAGGTPMVASGENRVF